VVAENVLGPLLAWLATAAIHGTTLCLVAWALASALARVLDERAVLAAVRERLWKFALFGGIATASFASAGATGWRVQVGLPAPPPPPARPVENVQFIGFDEPGIARPPRAAAPAPTKIPWIEIAAGFWILGVGVGAARFARDRRELARRLRSREPIETGPAFERLAELCRRSQSSLRVRLSRAPCLTAPITRGILRPEICIPPRAERDLMPDELEAMLAHELAHAQRRDPLLLALCRAVEIVFFFQPLARFARVQLLDEAEILCDARAAQWTGDPASLASCLAEVATWIVAGGREASALPMAARGTRLELRVRSLLEDREPASKRRRSWLAVPATLTLAAAPLAMPAVSMEAVAPSRTPMSSPAPAPERELEPAPAASLADGADELTSTLEELEVQFASIASEPALADASTELRERLSKIGDRLQTLRAMRAELDTLIAEDASAESQQQP
jgi:hypothetical protein